MKPSNSRRGRPTSAKLSRETIAHAALTLVDERGWERLTMTALAQSLSVQAPSLYNHISGQADLIDLVREQIVREIDVSQLHELDWREATRVFGLSYYQAFYRHPNAIQTLSVTPVNDATTFAMYEAYLAVLKRDEWSAAMALELLSGLEYLALGSAYEANAPAQLLTPEHALSFNAPVLAEFLRERDRTTSKELVDHLFARLLDDFIEMFTLQRIRQLS